MEVSFLGHDALHARRVLSGHVILACSPVSAAQAGLELTFYPLLVTLPVYCHGASFVKNRKLARDGSTGTRARLAGARQTEPNQAVGPATAGAGGGPDVRTRRRMRVHYSSMVPLSESLQCCSQLYKVASVPSSGRIQLSCHSAVIESCMHCLCLPSVYFKELHCKKGTGLDLSIVGTDSMLGINRSETEQSSLRLCCPRLVPLE